MLTLDPPQLLEPPVTPTLREDFQAVTLAQHGLCLAKPFLMAV
jgi:hypothetical protein